MRIPLRVPLLCGAKVEGRAVHPKAPARASPALYNCSSPTPFDSSRMWGGMRWMQAALLTGARLRTAKSCGPARLPRQGHRSRRKPLNRRTILALSSSVALCALIRGGRTGFAAPAQIEANAQTQAIVAATMAFLNALGTEQREKVQFPFTRQPMATAAYFKGGPHGNVTFVGEQYGQAMWSDLPVSDVPRPGLRLGSLSAAQRDAVMQMLQVLLSARGYQKVLDIMGSDQALAEDTHFSGGPEYYTLGIFGVPSLATPWMVQFGGHHLALN